MTWMPKRGRNDRLRNGHRARRNFFSSLAPGRRSWCRSIGAVGTGRAGALRKAAQDKPVVCILMDRPVYGQQFISKSKVMAAGLRQSPSSDSWSFPFAQPLGRRRCIKISNKYKNGNVHAAYLLAYFGSVVFVRARSGVKYDGMYETNFIYHGSSR